MASPVPPHLMTWKDWKLKMKFKLIKCIELGMNYKAMPRIMMGLWEHTFHEPYSFIFIRPEPFPPLISIFYILYFLFKKNMRFFIKKYI